MANKLISILFIILFFSSCRKNELQQKAHVHVKIDYFGNGGIYSDNIDGIPHGLIIGNNGPFDVEPNKEFKISYTPDSRWSNPVQYEDATGFKSGKNYTIHCYIENTTDTEINGVISIIPE